MTEQSHDERLGRHDERLVTVEQDVNDIKKCLERIEKDLNWYRRAVGIAKTLFFIALALLTAKFSDASTLFKTLLVRG